MKFVEEFRDEKLARTLLEKIEQSVKSPIRLMEVCGGHTMAIRRYGIHTLLPKEIELLSGPGCPVCVTDQRFIDLAIAYASREDTILLSYGDMLRVPGSFSSLEKEKASGADLRIIYSTLQALQIARENPEKIIVFAAIGFETTTPGTALAILQAEKEGLENFKIICAHKTMPEAMAALLKDGIPIDGYIGPGHVSSIAGSKIFDSLCSTYNIPLVIAGFEPLDLLQAILMIVEMINTDKSGVAIQYQRLVSLNGNIRAQKIVNEVFEAFDEYWRGIGKIPSSGLKLCSKYSAFDAERSLPVEVSSGPEPKGCLCGEILKGLKRPDDCPLFGRKCTPSYPIGACMVSSEGSCNAYFQYKSLI